MKTHVTLPVFREAPNQKAENRRRNGHVAFQQLKNCEELT